MEHEIKIISSNDLKEFFKSYREKLNNRRAIDILNFLLYFFPENRELSGILFEIKNDWFLVRKSILEAIENGKLESDIQHGIKNHFYLAYNELDGGRFRKLLKKVEIDDSYKELCDDSLETFIEHGIEQKYSFTFEKFNEQEILDILNGKEE